MHLALLAVGCKFFGPLEEYVYNYLINIGSDHPGRFPIEAQDILRTVAEMEKKENK